MKKLIYLFALSVLFISTAVNLHAQTPVSNNWIEITFDKPIGSVVHVNALEAAHLDVTNWVDLNYNGVYDGGSELWGSIHDDTFVIQNQTITLKPYCVITIICKVWLCREILRWKP